MEVTFGEKIALSYITLIKTSAELKNRANKSNGPVQLNWCQSSFKMFPCFWLVKTTRIIHQNQLLLTIFVAPITEGCNEPREYQGKTVNPHIGLISRVIPLKLFLDMVPRSSKDVTVIYWTHTALCYHNVVLFYFSICLWTLQADYVINDSAYMTSPFLFLTRIWT